jgi:hypothetical protein
MTLTEEYDDFIGIYAHSVSREDCDRIIRDVEKFFETSPKESITAGAAQTPFLEFTRLDYSVNATVHLPEAARIVDEALNQCIQKYAAQYFVTRQLRASTKEVKLQKTPPRGGYHFWHCENFNKETANRALAWMIYLNDIPEGEGETEFIWQKRRVQPEAGKCLLWPTQFTHTHRGNPVYSTTKYIATGWYTLDA